VNPSKKFNYTKYNEER